VSETEAQQRITALSKWLDESEANVRRPAAEATLLRFLKVGEEAGEMFAEIIGWTGQNPRKGVTANLLDVIEEALDVAITAIGAVEHATGNNGEAFRLLFKKIQDVDARRLGSTGPIASDVKIDKFLAGTEGDSAAEPISHDHSSTDPWSAGPHGDTAYIDGCIIASAVEPRRDPVLEPDTSVGSPQHEGLPEGFDPECHKCQVDRHLCPGCGENLKHGQTSCGNC
jgi:hypothetical protein